jgi:hypothetical protein
MVRQLTANLLPARRRDSFMLARGIGFGPGCVRVGVA